MISFEYICIIVHSINYQVMSNPNDNHHPDGTNGTNGTNNTNDTNSTNDSNNASNQNSINLSNLLGITDEPLETDSFMQFYNNALYGTSFNNTVGSTNINFNNIFQSLLNNTEDNIFNENMSPEQILQSFSQQINSNGGNLQYEIFGDNINDDINNINEELEGDEGGEEGYIPISTNGSLVDLQENLSDLNNVNLDVDPNVNINNVEENADNYGDDEEDNEDDDEDEDVDDDDEDEDVDDDDDVIDPFDNPPPPVPIALDPYQQYFAASLNGSLYRNTFLNDITKISAGFSTPIWLWGIEMNKIPAETEEEENNLEIMRTQQMSIIIEQTSSIMECIPEDFKEQSGVQQYMNEIFVHFNGVVEHLSQFDYYEVAPIEIFLWIAMMEACRLEPKIIPFLSCHSMMTSSIMKREGYAGLNCMRYSCMSELSDGLEQLLSLDSYTPDDLLIPDPNGYTAVMWAAAFSPFVTDYIISNKLVTKDNFWKGINGNGVEPFMIACEKGCMSAAIILKSDYMEKEYFDKNYYKGRSPLMAAACSNTELGKEFLSHEWCTKEYFERTESSYNAMVFHLTCISNHDMALHLLSTDRITKDVLLHQFGPSTLTTFIPYIIQNMDLIKGVFSHAEFDSSVLTAELGEGDYVQPPLLYYFITHSMELLTYILDSDKIGTNDLKITHAGKNVLTWMINKRAPIDMIKTLVNHPKFSKDIMEYVHDNKTVLHTLCNYQIYSYEYTVNYKKQILNFLIKSQYIEPVFIKPYLGTLVKLHPQYDIIPSLLEHKKLDGNMLMENITVPSLVEGGVNETYILYHFLILKFDNVVKHIMNSECVTLNMLLQPCNEHNNFATMVLHCRPYELKYVLLSEKCTGELLCSTDNEGNNILLTVLKNQGLLALYSNEMVELVSLIVNGTHCTENIINHKNNAGETPFMMGIKNCFEAADIIKGSNKFKNDDNISTETCLQYLKAAISSENLSGVKVITSLPGFDNSALLIEDDNKDTCYHYAAKSTLNIFEYLIKMEGFNEEILLKINNTGNTCFSIAVESSHDIANYLLDNNLVKGSMLSQLNSDEYNSLQVACFLANTELVKKILAHPDMSPDIISHKTALGYNIFGYGELSDQILVTLMESAHFNIDMLKELKSLQIGDVNDENSMVTFSISIYMEMIYRGRIEPVKKMLEHVHDSSIFETVDMLQNNILLASSKDKELCKVILDNEYLSHKSIMQQNAREETILMLLMEKDDSDNIEKLLKLEVFDPTLITKVQSNAHTVLNYVKPFSSSFNCLVNTNHLKKEFIDSYTDNNKNNFAMLLVKNMYYNIEEFLKSDDSEGSLSEV